MPSSDIETLAHTLDDKFKGPFGLKFGWDGIIGLIPGVGDIITSSLSFYIILRGASLGVPGSVLFKLCLNVIIETIVGFIPVAGNVFDFAWKANQRNIKIIQFYQKSPRPSQRSARLTVFMFFVLCLTVIVGSLLFAFYFLTYLWIGLKLIIY